jgi:hypothetical protein
MLAIPYLVVAKLLPKPDIPPTKNNYLASVKITYTVNIYAKFTAPQNL